MPHVASTGGLRQGSEQGPQCRPGCVEGESEVALTDADPARPFHRDSEVVWVGQDDPRDETVQHAGSGGQGRLRPTDKVPDGAGLRSGLKDKRAAGLVRSEGNPQ